MNSSGVHAIAADHVFDGTVVHEHTAVVLDGARIVDLVPTSDLPRTTPIRELAEDAWLAPGFIDVQANGGGDVLFNDQPTVQGIRSIAAAHRKFGTTGLLPTLISDSPEKNLAFSAFTSKAPFYLPKNPACTTHARSDPRPRTNLRC
jgi:N-acetylglucosamine-6-phosphate deacetylase